MKHWYAVPRSYRVRDEVYVQAETAAEARALAENHDYAEASAGDPASGTRYGRARRLAGSSADALSREHDADAFYAAQEGRDAPDT